MASKPTAFPSPEDVLEFIKTSPSKVTKREIARAFHIRGPDKVHLKKLLREMTEDGLLARDDMSRALRPAGDLPGVTVIEVTGTDRDGHPLAKPVQWDSDEAPPPIRVTENQRRRGPALGPGDRALVRLKRLDGEAGYEARVMKALKKSEAGGTLGVFKGGVNGGRVHPVDKKDRNEYWVHADDVDGAKDGELVMITPKRTRGRHRGGPNAATIKQNFGDVSDPRSISLIAIHKFGIPMEFPSAVTKEAEAAEPVTLDGRVDLRQVPLITIDPADARDHDDAIFAEPDNDPDNPGGWHVIVAIADVAQYVRPGSALDKEARKRGNSCYFPDRVVPMLPESLSAGLCSLMPGEDRACLACHMWFDVQGRKTGHKFERAVMNSHANLTYGAAQAAFDGQPGADIEPLYDRVLEPLYGAWEAMAAARHQRAPLDLDLPERRIELDETGQVAGISLRERLDAHRLVEDYMVNANVAAAEALEEKRMRPVYRVHEEPPMDKMEALREFLDSLGFNLAKGQVTRPAIFNGILSKVKASPEEKLVNEVILRSQTQAFYSPDNRGHFGLALARYAHFTSPIRRYADLLVHRALIRAYGLGPGGLSKEDEADLDATSEHISQMERRAMMAERETTDRYLAAYLGEREGEQFVGRISGVSRFGMFVTLEPSGGDGLIPISQIGSDYYALDEAGHALVGERSGKQFRIGDQLDVRLLEANAYTGGLRLELLSDSAEAGRGRRRRRNKPGKNGKTSPSHAKKASPKGGQGRSRKAR